TPLYSEENSDGLVLDGFIFDGATWNNYKDGSLDLETSPLAPLVRLRGADSPITVRNCLFVNASDGAVVLDCALAVFENNVVVNTSSDSLVLNANGAGPATVRNNAFGANLFNHLCDCQYLFADGTNWVRRVEGDSSYALDGNKLGVST